jgi:hypothetical protein
MMRYIGEATYAVVASCRDRRRQAPNVDAVPRDARFITFIAVSLAAFGGIQQCAAMTGDMVPQEADRPKINADRWREDWSSLALPENRTRALDRLKYIALSESDPGRYVSFGLTVREIFESSDAPALGTMQANPRDSYGLQRAQFHVDVRLAEHWQLFTQVEDVRAFDKNAVSATDVNRSDLRLAFLAYSRALGTGVLSARVGRQDFVFDIERFMSSRDGPNVRQSFDAVWAGWETEKWRLYALVSQPVVYRNRHAFDDTSNGDMRLSGVRLELQPSDDIQLSGYYALYQRRHAAYLDASGEEDRHVVDIRSAGTHAGFDWDVEAMGQFGRVGSTDIRAWAFGARTGYTAADIAWSPRIGLQFDIASGDRRPGDSRVETFYPLFPNGFYFSLGGHTGYTNLIHLKPSLSLKPTAKATLTAGMAALWRQTTHDAVYTLPSIPMPRTAGRGTSWTGAYAQLRVDYRFTPALSGSVELVRYTVGASLRAAGAHDSDYVRVETKFAW